MICCGGKKKVNKSKLPQNLQTLSIPKEDTVNVKYLKYIIDKSLIINEENHI